MFRALICGFLLVQISLKALALPCHALPSKNIEVVEKVYPVQLLHLHQKGKDIVDMNFSGTGICYSSAIWGLSSEEADWNTEVLGAGKGGGKFTFLKKLGEKHAMWFKSEFYPYDEQLCKAVMQRESEITDQIIEKGFISRYNHVTKKYEFQESNGPLNYLEEREIRMTEDGKGITVHFVDSHILKYGICYFSIR
ncbi:MAG: hypothetical protein ACXVCY_15260 [Pseudobdellovibrionaceae bacterium]